MVMFVDTCTCIYICKQGTFVHNNILLCTLALFGAKLSRRLDELIDKPLEIADVVMVPLKSIQ